MSILSHRRKAFRSAGSPPAEETDPYFDNVVLLIHADDENGTTNPVDSSNEEHICTLNEGAIVRNEPNFLTACLFDGSGDYLTIPNSTDFDFGTGDFTLEFRYAFGQYGGFHTIYSNGYTSAGALLIQTLANSGTIRVYVQGVLIITAVSQARNNHYYTYSLVRQGDNYLFYRDGVLVGSGTSTVSLASVTDLDIGARASVSTLDYFVNGKLDEYRITKGVCRYPLSHSVEVATLPEGGSDPYWSDVALLLKMEGTNGSTSFTDLSDNTHAVTALSNAQVSTAQSKFGSSSLFLDGTSSLSIADDPSLELGSGDFTIECWCYVTNTATRTVMARWSSGQLSWYLGIGGTSMGFYYSTGASRYACALTTLPALNEWFKLSVVRQGEWIALFVNGELTSKPYYAGSEVFVDGTSTLNIGDDNNSNAGFYGYIDEVRITKAARYDLSYAIPTEGFPTNGSEDPYWSDVKLLLKMEGAEGSTSIVDSSTSAHTVSVFGDTHIISTTKFGGILSFDGVNDSLSIPHSDAFDFGDGDFTLEFVVRPAFLSGVRLLFNQRSNTSQYCPVLMFFNGSVLYVYCAAVSNAWFGTVISVGGFVVGQEYHLALVRDGTSIQVYVDGVQSGATITTSDPLYDTAEPLYIGGVGTTLPFGGDMDEIRLTKGVARYTDTFTPPTTPFPDSAPVATSDPYFDNVKLLLHCDEGGFADSSGTPATVATNSVTLDESVKKFSAGSASCRVNNAYLAVTDDGRFGVTSEDWTLEMFVAPDTTSGFITGRVLWRSGFCRIYTSGTDDIAVSVSFNSQASGVVIGTSAINMTLGTFYYVTVTRSGSTFEFRIDGVLIGSYTNALAHNGSAYDVNIGAILGGSNYSRSWIDEVRFTSGVARDVSVVPTEPFFDS